ncbi:hypothetical protein Y1Q_0000961 [Alligator mississippiensis]|uniref:Uncharacterized protein n=1 Tax=Alligator mississippiensis TaxID=8496 RepID=A0A151NE26_ALLMI|nr:hypothetical protein Y1Q_0000961 [Alligator mississippiensis]
MLSSGAKMRQDFFHAVKGLLLLLVEKATILGIGAVFLPVTVMNLIFVAERETCGTRLLVTTAQKLLGAVLPVSSVLMGNPGTVPSLSDS